MILFCQSNFKKFEYDHLSKDIVLRHHPYVRLGKILMHLFSVW